MRMLAIFTAAIALLVTLLWVIAKPGLDSGAAVATALAAFCAAFFLKKADKEPAQSQRVGDGGIGVQAGGDVSIGDIGQRK